MLVYAVIGALVTALVTSGVSIYAIKNWVPKWPERGYVDIKPSWNRLFSLSAVVGTVVSLIAGLMTLNLALGVLFGVIAYVLFFTGVVDYQVKLAPKELTTFGIIAAIVLSGIALLTGATYLDETITGNLLNDSLIQIGMWTVMTFLFALVIAFAAPGGMGWADFKIMWMVGFAFAGFIGFVPVGILFTLGVVIQGLGFIVARIKKSGNKTLPLIPALSATYIIGGLWFLVT